MAISSSPAFALNRNSRVDDNSALIGGESHPIAGIVCMIGVFMRIVVSDPIMALFGLDFASNSAEGGNFLAKIHPGAYLIYVAFAILVFGQGRPLRQLSRIFQDFKVYGSLLGLYVILFIYWALRSPVGVGMLIDTHMTVPIAAIIMSYTPRSYCRFGINGFTLIAVINSAIGIGESITKTRIFTFDPTWSVLFEQQFRASALLGHPLTNATFTCMALLIAMTMDYSRVLKVLMACIFMGGLVAFGSRAALIIGVLSLIPIAVNAIKEQAKSMTLIKMCFMIAAVIIVPVVFTGGLYLLLNSTMGERLMAFSSFNDSSAETRVLILHVFDHMSPEELLFGIPSDRVEDIAWQVGLTLPLSDIENPWILMLMLLGAFMFCFWLPMTLLFAYTLMKDKPFGLKVAVVAYYVIVSTSNSFGRKDSLYTIMAASVIAAARALELHIKKPSSAAPSSPPPFGKATVMQRAGQP